MTDKLFLKLWQDALEQPDKELYVGEYGYPDWFDDINANPDTVVHILQNIHDIAHMSVRDIISTSGLTQAAFSIKFCIPLRTIEDWATEKRKCADYIRLMFAKILGLLESAAD